MLIGGVQFETPLGNLGSKGRRTRKTRRTGKRAEGRGSGGWKEGERGKCTVLVVMTVMLTHGGDDVGDAAMRC